VGNHLTAVVVPLVAQIDALRQMVERQADELVTYAETIGRLTAENEALKAAQAALTALTAPEPPASTTEPPTPWWRA